MVVVGVVVMVGVLVMASADVLDSVSGPRFWSALASGLLPMSGVDVTR